jgi:hypothetical protein
MTWDEVLSHSGSTVGVGEGCWRRPRTLSRPAQLPQDPGHHEGLLVPRVVATATTAVPGLHLGARQNDRGACARPGDPPGRLVEEDPGVVEVVRRVSEVPAVGDVLVRRVGLPVMDTADSAGCPLLHSMTVSSSDGSRIVFSASTNGTWPRCRRTRPVRGSPPRPSTTAGRAAAGDQPVGHVQPADTRCQATATKSEDVRWPQPAFLVPPAAATAADATANTTSRSTSDSRGIRTTGRSRKEPYRTTPPVRAVARGTRRDRDRHLGANRPRSPTRDAVRSRRIEPAQHRPRARSSPGAEVV